MKIIQSKFTIYYVATKLLYLIVIVAVFMIPLSIVFMMLSKDVDYAQLIALFVLVLLCGSFVYRFLETMTIIRFSFSPQYFSIRNVMLMRTLKYKYARIVKFYRISGQGTEYAAATREMALGNRVQGIYVLFDDDFEVEITSQDYQNLEDIWNVLCEKVE